MYYLPNNTMFPGTPSSMYLSTTETSPRDRCRRNRRCSRRGCRWFSPPQCFYQGVPQPRSHKRLSLSPRPVSNAPVSSRIIAFLSSVIVVTVLAAQHWAPSDGHPFVPSMIGVRGCMAQQHQAPAPTPSRVYIDIPEASGLCHPYPTLDSANSSSSSSSSSNGPVPRVPCVAGAEVRVFVSVRLSDCSSDVPCTLTHTLDTTHLFGGRTSSKNQRLSQGCSGSGTNSQTVLDDEYADANLLQAPRPLPSSIAMLADMRRWVQSGGGSGIVSGLSASATSGMARVPLCGDGRRHSPTLVAFGNTSSSTSNTNTTTASASSTWCVSNSERLALEDSYLQSLPTRLLEPLAFATERARRAQRRPPLVGSLSCFVPAGDRAVRSTRQDMWYRHTDTNFTTTTITTCSHANSSTFLSLSVTANDTTNGPTTIAFGVYTDAVTGWPTSTTCETAASPVPSNNDNNSLFEAVFVPEIVDVVVVSSPLLLTALASESAMNAQTQHRCSALGDWLANATAMVSNASGSSATASRSLMPAAVRVEVYAAVRPAVREAMAVERAHLVALRMERNASTIAPASTTAATVTSASQTTSVLTAATASLPLWRVYSNGTHALNCSVAASPTASVTVSVSSRFQRSTVNASVTTSDYVRDGVCFSTLPSPIKGNNTTSGSANNNNNTNATVNEEDLAEAMTAAEFAVLFGSASTGALTIRLPSEPFVVCWRAPAVEDVDKRANVSALLASLHDFNAPPPPPPPVDASATVPILEVETCTNNNAATTNNSTIMVAVSSSSGAANATHLAAVSTWSAWPALPVLLPTSPIWEDDASSATSTGPAIVAPITGTAQRPTTDVLRLRMRADPSVDDATVTLAAVLHSLPLCIPPFAQGNDTAHWLAVLDRLRAAMEAGGPSEHGVPQTLRPEHTPDCATLVATDAFQSLVLRGRLSQASQMVQSLGLSTALLMLSRVRMVPRGASCSDPEASSNPSPSGVHASWQGAYWPPKGRVAITADVVWRQLAGNDTTAAAATPVQYRVSGRWGPANNTTRLNVTKVTLLLPASLHLPRNLSLVASPTTASFIGDAGNASSVPWSLSLADLLSAHADDGPWAWRFALVNRTTNATTSNTTWTPYQGHRLFCGSAWSRQLLTNNSVMRWLLNASTTATAGGGRPQWHAFRSRPSTSDLLAVIPDEDLGTCGGVSFSPTASTTTTTGAAPSVPARWGAVFAYHNRTTNATVGLVNGTSADASPRHVLAPGGALHWLGALLALQDWQANRPAMVPSNSNNMSISPRDYFYPSFDGKETITANLADVVAINATRMQPTMTLFVAIPRGEQPSGTSGHGDLCVATFWDQLYEDPLAPLPSTSTGGTLLSKGSFSSAVLSEVSRLHGGTAWRRVVSATMELPSDNVYTTAILPPSDADGGIDIRVTAVAPRRVNISAAAVLEALTRSPPWQGLTLNVSQSTRAAANGSVPWGSSNGGDAINGEVRLVRAEQFPSAALLASSSLAAHAAPATTDFEGTALTTMDRLLQSQQFGCAYAADENYGGPAIISASTPNPFASQRGESCCELKNTNGVQALSCREGPALRTCRRSSTGADGPNIGRTAATSTLNGSISTGPQGSASVHLGRLRLPPPDLSVFGILPTALAMPAATTGVQGLFNATLVGALSAVVPSRIELDWLLRRNTFFICARVSNGSAWELVGSSTNNSEALELGYDFSSLFKPFEYLSTSTASKTTGPIEGALPLSANAPISVPALRFVLSSTAETTVVTATFSLVSPSDPPALETMAILQQHTQQQNPLVAVLAGIVPASMDCGELAVSATALIAATTSSSSNNSSSSPVAGLVDMRRLSLVNNTHFAPAHFSLPRVVLLSASTPTQTMPFRFCVGSGSTTHGVSSLSWSWHAPLSIATNATTLQAAHIATTMPSLARMPDGALPSTTSLSDVFVPTAGPRLTVTTPAGARPGMWSWLLVRRASGFEAATPLLNAATQRASVFLNLTRRNETWVPTSCAAARAEPGVFAPLRSSAALGVYCAAEDASASADCFTSLLSPQKDDNDGNGLYPYRHFALPAVAARRGVAFSGAIDPSDANDGTVLFFEVPRTPPQWPVDVPLGLVVCYEFAGGPVLEVRDEPGWLPNVFEPAAANLPSVLWTQPATALSSMLRAQPTDITVGTVGGAVEGALGTIDLHSASGALRWHADLLKLVPATDGCDGLPAGSPLFADNFGASVGPGTPSTSAYTVLTDAFNVAVSPFVTTGATTHARAFLTFPINASTAGRADAHRFTHLYRACYLSRVIATDLSYDTNLWQDLGTLRVQGHGYGFQLYRSRAAVQYNPHDILRVFVSTADGRAFPLSAQPGEGEVRLVALTSVCAVDAAVAAAVVGGTLPLSLTSKGYGTAWLFNGAGGGYQLGLGGDSGVNNLRGLHEGCYFDMPSPSPSSSMTDEVPSALAESYFRSRNVDGKQQAAVAAEFVIQTSSPPLKVCFRPPGPNAAWRVLTFVNPQVLPEALAIVTPPTPITAAASNQQTPTALVPLPPTRNSIDLGDSALFATATTTFAGLAPPPSAARSPVSADEIFGGIQLDPRWDVHVQLNRPVTSTAGQLTTVSATTTSNKSRLVNFTASVGLTVNDSRLFYAVKFVQVGTWYSTYESGLVSSYKPSVVSASSAPASAASPTPTATDTSDATNAAVLLEACGRLHSAHGSNAADAGVHLRLLDLSRALATGTASSPAKAFPFRRWAPPAATVARTVLADEGEWFDTLSVDADFREDPRQRSFLPPGPGVYVACISPDPVALPLTEESPRNISLYHHFLTPTNISTGGGNITTVNTTTIQETLVTVRGWRSESADVPPAAMEAILRTETRWAVLGPNGIPPFTISSPLAIRPAGLTHDGLAASMTGATGSDGGLLSLLLVADMTNPIATQRVVSGADVVFARLGRSCNGTGLLNETTGGLVSNSLLPWPVAVVAKVVSPSTAATVRVTLNVSALAGALQNISQGTATPWSLCVMERAPLPTFRNAAAAAAFAPLYFHIPDIQTVGATAGAVVGAGRSQQVQPMLFSSPAHTARLLLSPFGGGLVWRQGSAPAQASVLALSTAATLHLLSHTLFWPTSERAVTVAHLYLSGWLGNGSSVHTASGYGVASLEDIPLTTTVTIEAFFSPSAAGPEVVVAISSGPPLQCEVWRVHVPTGRICAAQRTALGLTPPTGGACSFGVRVRWSLVSSELGQPVSMAVETVVPVTLTQNLTATPASVLGTLSTLPRPSELFATFPTAPCVAHRMRSGGFGAATTASECIFEVTLREQGSADTGAPIRQDALTTSLALAWPEVGTVDLPAEVTLSGSPPSGGWAAGVPLDTWPLSVECANRTAGTQQKVLCRLVSPTFGAAHVLAYWSAVLNQTAAAVAGNTALGARRGSNVAAFTVAVSVRDRRGLLVSTQGVVRIAVPRVAAVHLTSLQQVAPGPQSLWRAFRLRRQRAGVEPADTVGGTPLRVASSPPYLRPPSASSFDDTAVPRRWDVASGTSFADLPIGSPLAIVAHPQEGKAHASFLYTLRFHTIATLDPLPTADSAQLFATSVSGAFVLSVADPSLALSSNATPSSSSLLVGPLTVLVRSTFDMVYAVDPAAGAVHFTPLAHSNQSDPLRGTITLTLALPGAETLPAVVRAETTRSIDPPSAASAGQRLPLVANLTLSLHLPAARLTYQCVPEDITVPDATITDRLRQAPYGVACPPTASNIGWALAVTAVDATGRVDVGFGAPTDADSDDLVMAVLDVDVLQRQTGSSLAVPSRIRLATVDAMRDRSAEVLPPPLLSAGFINGVAVFRKVTTTELCAAPLPDNGLGTVLIDRDRGCMLRVTSAATTPLVIGPVETVRPSNTWLRCNVNTTLFACTFTTSSECLLVSSLGTSPTVYTPNALINKRTRMCFDVAAVDGVFGLDTLVDNLWVRYSVFDNRTTGRARLVPEEAPSWMGPGGRSQPLRRGRRQMCFRIGGTFTTPTPVYVRFTAHRFGNGHWASASAGQCELGPFVVQPYRLPASIVARSAINATFANSTVTAGSAATISLVGVVRNTTQATFGIEFTVRDHYGESFTNYTGELDRRLLSHKVIVSTSLALPIYSNTLDLADGLVILSYNATLSTPFLVNDSIRLAFNLRKSCNDCRLQFLLTDASNLAFVTRTFDSPFTSAVISHTTGLFSIPNETTTRRALAFKIANSPLSYWKTVEGAGSAPTVFSRTCLASSTCQPAVSSYLRSFAETADASQLITGQFGAPLGVIPVTIDADGSGLTSGFEPPVSVTSSQIAVLRDIYTSIRVAVTAVPLAFENTTTNSTSSPLYASEAVPLYCAAGTSGGGRACGRVDSGSLATVTQEVPAEGRSIGESMQNFVLATLPTAVDGGRKVTRFLLQTLDVPDYAPTALITTVSGTTRKLVQREEGNPYSALPSHVASLMINATVLSTPLFRNLSALPALAPINLTHLYFGWQPRTRPFRLEFDGTYAGAIFPTRAVADLFLPNGTAFVGGGVEASIGGEARQPATADTSGTVNGIPKGFPLFRRDATDVAFSYAAQTVPCNVSVPLSLRVIDARGVIDGQDLPSVPLRGASGAVSITSVAVGMVGVVRLQLIDARTRRDLSMSMTVESTAPATPNSALIALNTIPLLYGTASVAVRFHAPCDLCFLTATVLNCSLSNTSATGSRTAGSAPTAAKGNASDFCALLMTSQAPFGATGATSRPLTVQCPNLPASNPPTPEAPIAPTHMVVATNAALIATDPVTGQQRSDVPMPDALFPVVAVDAERPNVTLFVQLRGNTSQLASVLPLVSAEVWRQSLAAPSSVLPTRLSVRLFADLPDFCLHRGLFTTDPATRHTQPCSGQNATCAYPLSGVPFAVPMDLGVEASVTAEIAPSSSPASLTLPTTARLTFRLPFPCAGRSFRVSATWRDAWTGAADTLVLPMHFKVTASPLRTPTAPASTSLFALVNTGPADAQWRVQSDVLSLLTPVDSPSGVVAAVHRQLLSGAVASQQPLDTRLAILSTYQDTAVKKRTETFEHALPFSELQRYLFTKAAAVGDASTPVGQVGGGAGGSTAAVTMAQRWLVSSSVCASARTSPQPALFNASSGQPAPTTLFLSRSQVRQAMLTAAAASTTGESFHVDPAMDLVFAPHPNVLVNVSGDIFPVHPTTGAVDATQGPLRREDGGAYVVVSNTWSTPTGILCTADAATAAPTAALVVRTLVEYHLHRDTSEACATPDEGDGSGGAPFSSTRPSCLLRLALVPTIPSGRLVGSASSPTNTTTSMAATAPAGADRLVFAEEVRPVVGLQRVLLFESSPTSQTSVMGESQMTPLSPAPHFENLAEHRLVANETLVLAAVGVGSDGLPVDLLSSRTTTLVVTLVHEAMDSTNAAAAQGRNRLLTASSVLSELETRPCLRQVSPPPTEGDVPSFVNQLAFFLEAGDVACPPLRLVAACPYNTTLTALRHETVDAAFLLSALHTSGRLPPSAGVLWNLSVPSMPVCSALINTTVRAEEAPVAAPAQSQDDIVSKDGVLVLQKSTETQFIFPRTSYTYTSNATMPVRTESLDTLSGLCGVREGVGAVCLTAFNASTYNAFRGGAITFNLTAFSPQPGLRVLVSMIDERSLVRRLATAITAATVATSPTVKLASANATEVDAALEHFADVLRHRQMARQGLGGTLNTINNNNGPSWSVAEQSTFVANVVAPPETSPSPAEVSASPFCKEGESLTASSAALQNGSFVAAWGIAAVGAAHQKDAFRLIPRPAPDMGSATSSIPPQSGTATAMETFVDLSYGGRVTIGVTVRQRLLLRPADASSNRTVLVEERYRGWPACGVARFPASAQHCPLLPLSQHHHRQQPHVEWPVRSGTAVSPRLSLALNETFLSAVAAQAPHRLVRNPLSNTTTITFTRDEAQACGVVVLDCTYGTVLAAVQPLPAHGVAIPAVYPLVAAIERPSSVENGDGRNGLRVGAVGRRTSVRVRLLGTTAPPPPATANTTGAAQGDMDASLLRNVSLPSMLLAAAAANMSTRCAMVLRLRSVMDVGGGASNPICRGADVSDARLRVQAPFTANGNSRGLPFTCTVTQGCVAEFSLVWRDMSAGSATCVVSLVAEVSDACLPATWSVNSSSSTGGGFLSLPFTTMTVSAPIPWTDALRSPHSTFAADMAAEGGAPFDPANTRLIEVLSEAMQRRVAPGANASSNTGAVPLNYTSLIRLCTPVRLVLATNLSTPLTPPGYAARGVPSSVLFRRGRLITGTVYRFLLQMVDSQGAVCAGDGQEDATTVAMELMEPTRFPQRVPDDFPVRVLIANVNWDSAVATTDPTVMRHRFAAGIAEVYVVFLHNATATAGALNESREVPFRIRFTAASPAPRFTATVLSPTIRTAIVATGLELLPKGAQPLRQPTRTTPSNVDAATRSPGADVSAWRDWWADPSPLTPFVHHTVAGRGLSYEPATAADSSFEEAKPVPWLRVVASDLSSRYSCEEREGNGDFWPAATFRNRSVPHGCFQRAAVGEGLVVDGGLDSAFPSGLDTSVSGLGIQWESDPPFVPGLFRNRSDASLRGSSWRSTSRSAPDDRLPFAISATNGRILRGGVATFWATASSTDASVSTSGVRWREEAEGTWRLRVRVRRELWREMREQQGRGRFSSGGGTSSNTLLAADEAMRLTNAAGAGYVSSDAWWLRIRPSQWLTVVAQRPVGFRVRWFVQPLNISHSPLAADCWFGAQPPPAVLAPSLACRWSRVVALPPTATLSETACADAVDVNASVVVDTYDLLAASVESVDRHGNTVYGDHDAVVTLTASALRASGAAPVALVGLEGAIVVEGGLSAAAVATSTEVIRRFGGHSTSANVLAALQAAAAKARLGSMPPDYGPVPLEPSSRLSTDAVHHASPPLSVRLAAGTAVAVFAFAPLADAFADGATSSVLVPTPVHLALDSPPTRPPSLLAMRFDSSQAAWRPSEPVQNPCFDEGFRSGVGGFPIMRAPPLSVWPTRTSAAAVRAAAPPTRMVLAFASASTGTEWLPAPATLIALRTGLAEVLRGEDDSSEAASSEASAGVRVEAANPFAADPLLAGSGAFRAFSDAVAVLGHGVRITRVCRVDYAALEASRAVHNAQHATISTGASSGGSSTNMIAAPVTLPDGLCPSACDRAGPDSTACSDLFPGVVSCDCSGSGVDESVFVTSSSAANEADQNAWASSMRRPGHAFIAEISIDVASATGLAIQSSTSAVAAQGAAQARILQGISNAILALSVEQQPSTTTGPISSRFASDVVPLAVKALDSTVGSGGTAEYAALNFSNALTAAPTTTTTTTPVPSSTTTLSSTSESSNVSSALNVENATTRSSSGARRQELCFVRGSQSRFCIALPLWVIAIVGFLIIV